MKDSQKYYAAMIAVVNNTNLCAADKLEILETLMANKRLAEYGEKEVQDEKV